MEDETLAQEDDQTDTRVKRTKTFAAYGMFFAFIASVLSFFLMLCFWLATLCSLGTGSCNVITQDAQTYGYVMGGSGLTLLAITGVLAGKALSKNPESKDIKGKHVLALAGIIVVLIMLLLGLTRAG